MTTYSIDNGRGEQTTAGVSEERVWIVAQRMADERGEPVYVYEGNGDGFAARKVEPRRGE